MKRALLFIFMTVCVLGMSACSSKDAMPSYGSIISAIKLTMHFGV